MSDGGVDHRKVTLSKETDACLIAKIAIQIDPGAAANSTIVALFHGACGTGPGPHAGAARHLRS